MSERTILGSPAEIARLLDQHGFRIARGTVYNQAVPGGVFAPIKRGANAGKWDSERVLRAAFARYGDKREAAEGEAAAASPPQENAGEARSLADARLKEVQAARAQLRLQVEQGRYVETGTIAAELGARARAFRLGLEKFLPERVERVAQSFGGGHGEALDLAERLGLGQESVPVIIDWCLSRSEPLRREWLAAVESFLDAYATGAWWTEEMRQAWESAVCASDEGGAE